MRKPTALILVLCLALPALAAVRKKGRSPARKTSTTAKKSASKKSAAKKPVAKKTAAKKTVAGKKRPASKSTSRTAGKRRRTPARSSWRGGQMTPTPARYKEIQQALIDKGYLSGSASGSWGADSTEALKKFQQSQNLDPTGKLDSLTLISLGLGPKREAGPPVLPAPAPPKPTPPPRGQQ